ncbi:MAG: ribonuclease P protein component [Pseudomonadota bacterium]
MMDRLRKRRDFLAAAKAQKAGVASLLLQGRNRGDTPQVRVGFTVTKKVGNAVVRNRIRRRLREAARAAMPSACRPGHDYVLIARLQALHAPFPDLVRDLQRALTRLHAPAGKTPADKIARADGARSE